MVYKLLTCDSWKQRRTSNVDGFLNGAVVCEMLIIFLPVIHLAASISVLVVPDYES